MFGLFGEVHQTNLQELHVGINEGAFGPASLKRERNPFALPRKGPGLLPG